MWCMSESKKLNVAMVAACPFPANRGTPSRILGMAEAMDALGHRVCVVTYHFGLDKGGRNVEIERIPGVPYARFSPGPTFTKLFLLDPLLFFKLLWIVRTKKIDLIHAHHFEGALVSFLVRKITGVQVIYDAHTTLESELFTYKFIKSKWLADFLDRKVPEWADHVIASSETLRDFIVSSGEAESKIDVIPTGIHVEDFASIEPSEIRSRYGLQEQEIVMYTGSLAAFQGVDYLIKAMKRVFDQYPEAALFLVVDSPNAQIARLCDELGIREKVFVEVVDNFESVPRYLASADIVVSPRTECMGFPQKLGNYMASQKAIVSFKGSAKLITDGYNGLVVAEKDVGALADAILRLLKDRDLRKQLGEKAKMTLQGRLDWSSLSVRVQTIYFNLLKHKELKNHAV